MLQFEDPGKVYFRTGEANYAKIHSELVNNWNRELERYRCQSREAMPVGRIQVYSVLIIILGILTLILQVRLIHLHIVAFFFTKTKQQNNFLWETDNARLGQVLVPSGHRP